MRVIELSHPITTGMKTYPGLPEPRTETLLDYEASRERYQGKAEFLIGAYWLCGNTGTYVDAPRHRFRAGADLAALPLESLAAIPVTVIDATAGGRAIEAPRFAPATRGGALLVRTDHSRKWGTPAYFEDNPFLTARACDAIVAAGIRFVGIDSLNIDDTGDPSRPAHTKLLGASIPVCEHMTNLKDVPSSGAVLHAVPLAWVDGATLPVRAYVVV